MLQSQDPKKVLEDFFGFKGFKGTQESIVNSVLNKEDCFVIMPTGAGKSLCYQLPAIMLKGTAIIISPLIALMKNQVDQLRGFAKEDSLAHFMNSSLNKSELEVVKEDIVSGATKILYIAPETLKKEDTIDFFKQIKISFVAVDEAHCISEWGHDFRPEYRRIKEMVKAIDDVPIIALTATATPKVQSDIQKNLGMQEAKVYKSSFNRDNLEAHLDNEVRRVQNYIISIVPEKELCWESADWFGELANGRRCRWLTPTVSGGTHLVHHEIMMGPLAWLIERVYRERIERGLALVDNSLAEALEAIK